MLPRRNSGDPNRDGGEPKSHCKSDENNSISYIS
jgi:hypothetical protein